MKSMKEAAVQAVEVTANVQEKISAEALGLTGFSLPSGEHRGVKIYALSFLPERMDEQTGKVLQATFGGLMEKITDPVTGEVRGVHGKRDSVPLSFFGKAAEQWAEALLFEPPQWVEGARPARVQDPKRDSVILGVRPDAEELTVLRGQDGRMKTVIATSRTFSGKVKIIQAAPPVEFEIG